MRAEPAPATGWRAAARRRVDPLGRACDDARVSLRARLCASLLAAGRPVTSRELASGLDLSPEALLRGVDELREALEGAELGIVVDEVADGYRLVVDPAVVPHLGPLLAPRPLPALSAAAIETLALIAYHQPITRGELEAARGASCASTLDTLQERELVKVVGRRDVVGRPSLFGTTDRFLVEFGLRSLDDLPSLEDDPNVGFLRG
jgi:segregation and condensation protein B